MRNNGMSFECLQYFLKNSLLIPSKTLSKEAPSSLSDVAVVETVTKAIVVRHSSYTWFLYTIMKGYDQCWLVL